MGPSPTLWNRIDQRLFVSRQDVYDRQHRAKLGLDTFPEDWNGLMDCAAVDSVLPRKVWMLWLQGPSDAPALIRASIQSWQRLNPDWDVVVLDAKSVHDWVEMPKFRRWTTPQARANILRIRLLRQYGGVWTDATTLCLKPLDEWIDRAARKGFFSFSRPEPKRSLANWFLAANPDHPLVHVWQFWSERYILSPLRPSVYHWMHYTFEWLLRKDPEFAEFWSSVPRVSARGPHILQRLMEGTLSESQQPESEQLSSIPLLKMNRRKGISFQAIVEAMHQHGFAVNFDERLVDYDEQS